MACQICGSASLAGAKLCDDCRAARKRAYDATVTQPFLVIAGEATARRTRGARLHKSSAESAEARARRATRKAAKARAALPVNESPRKANAPLLFAAVLVTLLLVLYGLHRMLTAPKADGEGYTPVQVRAEAVEPTASTVQRPGQQVPLRPVPSNDVSANAAASPAAATTNVTRLIPPIDGEDAGAATRGVPAKSIAVKRAPLARAPTPTTTPGAETVPEALLPVPAPVVETRPPPRVDPWQQMAEAIGGCSREGFLGRVICEQKVRLQYCDGHWGQVAQCPGGPQSDR